MRRTPEEAARLVESAVKEIALTPSRTVCITVRRAEHKRGRMFPTDNQEKLLQHIEERGHVPFIETLGMDWRFLGGLFTRGLVKWRVWNKGQYVIVPASVK
jgi:hypothetical protein